MYWINYDFITGFPETIGAPGLCIPVSNGSREFRKFLAWNAKQDTPLDYKTPIAIEKQEPKPTVDDKLSILEAKIEQLIIAQAKTAEDVDKLIKVNEVK